jgi:hypothetical protein
MHPLEKLRLERVPTLDFGVMQHHFAPHGRDYILIIENNITANPGRHELTFTHCVKAEVVTAVRDEVWAESWSDDFTDFERWTKVGEPNGYVWGNNWSLAYPGFEAVLDSVEAAEWSGKLGKEMFEFRLETDRFTLRIIFHSIHFRKISDDTSVVSAVVFPLKR